MDERRLDGQTAVITGASRGLGRSIALAFAREGASVVVGARTDTTWENGPPGTVHTTVEQIIAAGGRAVAVVCDVMDETSRHALIEITHDTYGPVDILVNNAALTISAKPGTAMPKGSTGDVPNFINFPLRAFRRHFEVGTFAAYHLMQLVLPDMIERRRGHILNISSTEANEPPPGPYPGTPRKPLAGYGGNKIALEHLTRCVAVEVASARVSVNVLSPSVPVSTPGVDALGLEDAEDPARFAEAAVRLALTDAASTTGQVLYHHDVVPAA